MCLRGKKINFNLYVGGINIKYDSSLNNTTEYLYCKYDVCVMFGS